MQIIAGHLQHNYSILEGPRMGSGPLFTDEQI